MVSYETLVRSLRKSHNQKELRENKLITDTSKGVFWLDNNYLKGDKHETRSQVFKTTFTWIQMQLPIEFKVISEDLCQQSLHNQRKCFNMWGYELRMWKKVS